MDFKFEIFKNEIDDDFRRIWKAQRQVENYEHYHDYGDYDGKSKDIDWLEAESFHRDILREYLIHLKTKIAYAIERLGCSDLLGKMYGELEPFKKEIAKLDFDTESDSFGSPVLGILRRYYGAILCEFGSSESVVLQDRFELLKRVLRGTPKIVSDNKIVPYKEAEVKNCIYNLLVHVFPDTVREVPIPHVSQTFKPDIGIRSLKAAIEYKYADSLQRFKESIRGVYEDTKGYSGSQDWTTFFAVFYMTDQFLTEAQVMEELKMSEFPSNWFPIMVTGRGRSRPIRNKST